MSGGESVDRLRQAAAAQGGFIPGVVYALTPQAEVGTAPCGATYGTAAGRNDGTTPCGACGAVHPVQVLLPDLPARVRKGSR